MAESDPRLVDLIMRQRGYTSLVGGQGIDFLWSEQARLAEVQNSRWMYHYDVTVERAVQMWTDFGFGQHVAVTPADEALAGAWHECWSARRNRSVFGARHVHELSNWLLVDGEWFLVAFVSTLDGSVTFRRHSTDKFTRIVRDPADPETPLYYVQATAEGEVYFSRNAVVDASFDELRPGQPVELVVQREESKKGLQASTVRPITTLEYCPRK